MTVRVNVKPQVLRWAREQAGLEPEELKKRFPKYLEWESGEVSPTYKQLRNFSKATHVAFGWFFASEPPDEEFRLPDRRTVGDIPIVSPSPNLRDIVNVCELRQDWYREHLLVDCESSVGFVGFATITDNVVTTAATLRMELKIGLDDGATVANCTEALHHYIRSAERAGVLVMLSGVVRSNSYRMLNPDEFRGFSMVDDLAPLVFVNAADTKATQMFTLAHEIAHLAIGQSALSNARPNSMQLNDVESWCSAVAAEFLVPTSVLRSEFRNYEPFVLESKRLARQLNVSTLVILRRLYDLGAISLGEFRRVYEEELRRLLPIRNCWGGSFYRTLTLRVGERFARELIVSTLAGKTLYRDAFYLLGIRKIETFRKFARHLGVGD